MSGFSEPSHCDGGKSKKAVVVNHTCFIFFRAASAIFSATVFSSSDRVTFSFFPVYKG
jgi:hypothetical protein